MLPDSAGADKRRLEEYGVKSTMVVPLNSKDGVWGYIGVDMVREHRNWCNEDYQWFVSLGNIISICMELRRSESEARLEKLICRIFIKIFLLVSSCMIRMGL